MKKKMNNRQTTILTVLVVIVGLQGVLGQREPEPGKTVDYNTVNMPESPTASALNAVGKTQVNTATGVPSISIPLYTYELDGVQVPISISYNATGVKVTELATSVGLNWSLEAGGQISRTVRGKTDEYRGWLNPTYTYLPGSWYTSYNPNNPHLWQDAMRGNALNEYNGYAKNRDHNPDLFNYSFPGASGAYIHTPAGAILKEKQDGIGLTALSDGHSAVSLTAHDLQGNVFFFDVQDVEQSSNKVITGANGDLTEHFLEWEGQNGFDPISAWKLSQITTKNDKTIHFEYQSETMEYMINGTSYHLTIGYDCNVSNQDPIKSLNKTTTIYDYTTQLIKKIWSPDGSIEVHFNYASDTGLPDSVWKTKLTSIVISDLLSGHIKEFRFTYERFDGDPRLKLTSVFEVGHDGSSNEVHLPPYEFRYNNGALPAKGSHAQDFFGYFNNSSGPNSLVPRLTNIPSPFQIYYNNNSRDRSLNTAALQRGILTGITYPTGGRTRFEYEPNALGGKYLGGLRIKSIEDVDETGTYHRRTYNYTGLKGFSLEDNIGLIMKSEGNTTTYYGNFTVLPGDLATAYKTGYFYEKVTVTSFNGTDNFKEEFEYEENPQTLHRYDYVLRSQTSYEGLQVVKRVEYINGLVGTPQLLSWNVLGDMECYNTPPMGAKLGYKNVPRVVNFMGSFSYLPTRIATTEYLKQGAVLNPVTTYQEIIYDPNTLLKKEEVTDYRRTRNGFNNYPIANGHEEKTTVTYKYPWDPTINLNLPASLPMKIDVVSLKNSNGKIFGQAFEYDNKGNIKTTYQYNKGQGSNNSPLGYIPSNYEETHSFLFQNGKPVQVKGRDGVPISYIYGHNGQYPVAKIENKAYYTIPSGLINAIHTASGSTGSESQLQTALNNLRNDNSMTGAMVTTYTHKPLVGVTSITGPNGDRIRYYYDEFGRLEAIRDKNGNLMEEYIYNYGNN